MFLLVVFLACVAVSLAATWHVRNFANARGWTDAPRTNRHLHSIPVPRLGGVAICFTCVTAVLLAIGIPRFFGQQPLFPANPALALLGPAFLVFLLGLVDDLRALSPWWKVAIESLAAVWLYAGGFGVHNLGLIFRGHSLHSIYGLPLTVLWVLLITNAFNLIDGLDGLAAGSALFSTVVLLVLSLAVLNSLVAFLAAALAGATLGFLRFNFHPATIFLGDSGSLFIGFMLAALALAGSQLAPTIVAVAIPLVSLGFPILDVVLAVARRSLTGKPLFDGDGNHIHHKLLRRGFSQRDAVLVLYAVTAGFGFLSLLLLQERRTIALVLSVIGIGIFLGIQQLRYQEFAELLSTLQRVPRRRQILANHVAIRHGAELLQTCHTIGAICRVLQETLEPIGFDAIRIQKLGKDGLPAAAIYPLQHGSQGSLFFGWSGGELDKASWELRLELVTSSKNRWGYFSIIRLSNQEPLLLDVNILTEHLRKPLSDAVDRVTSLLEAPEAEVRARENRRSMAVGTGAD